MEHTPLCRHARSVLASQTTVLPPRASTGVSLGQGGKTTASTWIGLVLIIAMAGTSRAAVATFEDLTVPLESYWNGADGSGGFGSGGAFFKNNYNAEWDSWDGFSYSNRTDTTAEGMDAQYNAITGSGQGGSVLYGVAFVGWEEPPTVTLTTSRTLEGLYVTNNNFAYYSMLNGNPPSKKFGGQTGDDEDWLKLTITGRDVGAETTGTVEFFLADFRFADNDLDYIVDTWEFVDLTSLQDVKSLEFILDSSDTGAFGMNTPAYFCIDTVVPEPATFLLLGLGSLLTVWRRK